MKPKVSGSERPASDESAVMLHAIVKRPSFASYAAQNVTFDGGLQAKLLTFPN